jgi:hypothetical protein
MTCAATRWIAGPDGPSFGKSIHGPEGPCSLRPQAETGFGVFQSWRDNHPTDEDLSVGTPRDCVMNGAPGALRVGSGWASLALNRRGCAVTLTIDSYFVSSCAC